MSLKTTNCATTEIAQRAFLKDRTAYICGGKRASRPRRVQVKPKATSTRPEGRPSTPQGIKNIDKTRSTVIDTTEKADDK
jgi:hypothetical protein